ncbi:helix-turn-helix domain-containing protein [Romboutsia sedimentorum]|uniref:Helix-turn-helix domain-containing protein n=1 Tax=Romboutsia sedimentorum TaxID=1368474 RepID=A0ABT7EAZ5_9FIRM|nr:helix-turn-helix domain-containing protein [Romboutsia sedimentorum]MDK2564099.1 helix-turn-helix domain-containing protein [Romboutsia sedimentorum]
MGIKISFEEKLNTVLKYINGEKGVRQSSYDLGVSETAIRDWIRIYKSIGIEGLKGNSENKNYSIEFKISPVEDYLSGRYSQCDVCSKYKISSRRVLQRWVKSYNNHNITKSHNTKENVIMIKGRKTTFDEKIEIVGFCIANNLDYQLTSNKYNVSYQQVYTWIRKYKSNGYTGLEDRRGKTKEVESLTEKEKLEMQMKLLKAENERLKMENDFLKKSEEIERR